MTIKAKALRGFLGPEGRVRFDTIVSLDREEFDRLKAIGLVEEAGDDAGPEGADDLDGRSLADLKELAKALGVDIGAAKKTADIIAAIRAHRAKG